MEETPTKTTVESFEIFSKGFTILAEATSLQVLLQNFLTFHKIQLKKKDKKHFTKNLTKLSGQTEREAWRLLLIRLGI